MITLDQISLLEQKIESAVAKIQQLQAENDALRNKCNELTNALSAKSEQLSSFELDQNQIELGIKKALDRLNSIENSVLKPVMTRESVVQAASPIQTPVQPTEPVSEEVEVPAETQISQPAFEEFAPSFDTMQDLDTNPEDDIPTEEPFESEEDDNQDGLGFDIF